jgi:hypothetical protein
MLDNICLYRVFIKYTVKENRIDGLNNLSYKNYGKIIVRKDTTFTFRLDKRIKKGLEIAAEKDRRSMASLLEKIIVDDLEEKGIVWESLKTEDQE